MAPRGPQRRSNYAQVSSSEEGSSETTQSNTRRRTEDLESNRSSNSTTTGRTERNNRYNRLSEEDDDDHHHDVETGESSGNTAREKRRTKRGKGSSKTRLMTEEDPDGDDTLHNQSKEGDAVEEELDSDDDGRRLTVVILDVAQKKFQVPVHPTASVAALKEAGAKIHKVSSDRQRLIYRGKMLQDEDNLADVGITSDRTIVHLFPKPRVVIKENHSTANASESATGEANSNRTSSSNHESGDEEDQGARVPTIVLDADEAERRSQILVLGSSDYLEAQNNVKLFSFMLLIISSIELMNLLAVALGVPQEEANEGGGISPNGEFTVTIDDDIFNTSDPSPAQNSTNAFDNSSNVAETWEAANWVDLVISIMGVYVGILGLQATTHNTLRLAKYYLIGTAITGVAWMVFNYVMTYEIDKEAANREQEDGNDDFDSLTDGDIRWQAVSVMVLPGMVWSLCCLRAWQFQHLLMEAEQEAEERIRSEFASVVRAAGDSSGDDAPADDNDDEEEGANSATRPNHDEELALQNESARIS